MKAILQRLKAARCGLYVCAVAALLLSIVTDANAITIAGSLVVDLDAARVGDVATSGSKVTGWTNQGSAGGVFSANDFRADSLTAAQPDFQTLGGAQAIVFDGGTDAGGEANIDRLEGGAAPASISGGSDWSMEAWIYNPTISAEEASFSWGRRGGPANETAHVGPGYNSVSGAVVHWGADQGFNAQLGDTEEPVSGNHAPAAGRWHHLAVTYDGTSGTQTENVYLDGQLNNFATRTLAISDSINMMVGTSFDPASGGHFVIPFSGGVAVVRMHDGVLTGPQVLGNFNDDAARFGLAMVPEPSTVALGIVGLFGLVWWFRKSIRR